jgi:hypothetical protein
MSNEIEAAKKSLNGEKHRARLVPAELYQAFKRRLTPLYIQSSMKQIEKELFQTHIMNLLLV